MSDDDLPFRCRRCGAFVGQQRLHEADDFGPAPCKSCRRRRGQRAIILKEYTPDNPYRSMARAALNAALGEQ